MLRARLQPLGVRLVCRSNLPDPVIDYIAARSGCVVATSDEHIIRVLMSACWVKIPQGYVERKSARDLATHILKQLRRQCPGWGR